MDSCCAGGGRFMLGLFLWGFIFHKKKIYMFFINNWVKIAIGFAVIALIVLSIWASLQWSRSTGT